MKFARNQNSRRTKLKQFNLACSHKVLHLFLHFWLQIQVKKTNSYGLFPKLSTNYHWYFYHVESQQINSIRVPESWCILFWIISQTQRNTNIYTKYVQQQEWKYCHQHRWWLPPMCRGITMACIGCGCVGLSNKQGETLTWRFHKSLHKSNTSCHEYQ